MKFINFLVFFPAFIVCHELSEFEKEVSKLDSQKDIERFLVSNKQELEDNLPKMHDDLKKKVEDTLSPLDDNTKTKFEDSFKNTTGKSFDDVLKTANKTVNKNGSNSSSNSSSNSTSEETPSSSSVRSIIDDCVITFFMLFIFA